MEFIKIISFIISLVCALAGVYMLVILVTNPSGVAALRVVGLLLLASFFGRMYESFDRYTNYF